VAIRNGCWTLVIKSLAKSVKPQNETPRLPPATLHRIQLPLDQSCKGVLLPLLAQHLKELLFLDPVGCACAREEIGVGREVDVLLYHLHCKLPRGGRGGEEGGVCWRDDDGSTCERKRRRENQEARQANRDRRSGTD
jgi:hypothetical protein